MRERPAGTANAELASGEIEVLCKEVEILNASVTPPFQLDDDNLSETTRLTHRVLDLRRPQMQRNLMLRYRVSIEVRKFLDQLGFIDIETPMLTKSTPEGARDYLVPSRVNAGHFFALPQSPQLFKQMLMVSGFDRYYQITALPRRRPARRPSAGIHPDRLRNLVPERTRDPRDLREHDPPRVQGGAGRGPAVAVPDHDLDRSHAPLRLGQAGPAREPEFTDMTDVMRARRDFSPPPRRRAAARARRAEMSRSEIDAYTQFVGIYGAKGLAYIKVNEVARDGLQSPIVKNLHDAALAELIKRTGAQDGDIIFFGADRRS